jgi:hypothetical protein
MARTVVTGGNGQSVLGNNMTPKLAALYLGVITISAAASQSNPNQSSFSMKWRLTDEASCTIETASQLPDHTSLHMIIGKRVAGVKQILVEGIDRKNLLRFGQIRGRTTRVRYRRMTYAGCRSTSILSMNKNERPF